MNIRRCYIENFGKLHQFEYRFSNGLNVINELNGWGKSTFAAFIKAMFFGFDNSNKRAISENERKKYYPWQGGRFGGNLEFEINGRVYEIERFFGQRDREDTFKLYNKMTNFESHDFSENIGEEIFKIDREAYERSTYISGQSIAIEINDSLSAKLSNILENDNDINSSDEAINKIISAMKEYKKIGNRGRINELETKINNKRRELAYAQKNEELINERNKKIEETKLEIRKLEETRMQNQEKINRQMEQESSRVKRERYNDICNSLKNSEQELERLKRYFNYKVPDDTDIMRYEETTYKLDTLSAKLNENTLGNIDKDRYEDLKNKFEGKEVAEGIINNYFSIYNEIEEIKTDLIRLNEKLGNQERIEKIEEKNNRKLGDTIIISILTIILGIILGTGISKYLYLICILGVLIFVLGITSNKKTNNKLDKNGKKNLIEEINGKNNKLNALTSDLEDFVNSFEKGPEGNYEKISRIKNEFTELKNLDKLINDKDGRLTEYQKDIENLVEDIYMQLMNYMSVYIDKNDITQFTLTCKNIILDIKSKKKEMENILLKIENDRKLKQRYEQENNINSLNIFEESVQFDKDYILRENELIERNITDLINQKSYDENEMNRLINTSISAEEIEREIQSLEQELNEINDKYDILDKTQEYLLKAKEQFSSHYLNRMTAGFEKYFNIINKERINTDIDVKLNVTVQEYGEKRDIEYLSTGYKDLIGICMRFALVDALFENERPFIILDDPFVNLDREKIERAKDIVNELSRKYQIIYFVCHESRE